MPGWAGGLRELLVVVGCSSFGGLVLCCAPGAEAFLGRETHGVSLPRAGRACVLQHPARAPAAQAGMQTS